MYSEIRKLHLELSSGCNARCPLCMRHTLDENVSYLNPLVTYNNNLTVEDIENIFSSTNIIDKVQISLCGNMGDPLFNKDIIKIIHKIIEFKRFSFITIDTNGGLGKEDAWIALANIKTKTIIGGNIFAGKLIVNFSIDGLEDTNHLYRRNVRWEKIMENVHTFISNGGNAHWKYIMFEHNKHQVEEAGTLATKLGFKDFFVSNNLNEGFDIPNIKVSENMDMNNIVKKNDYKGFVDAPQCKDWKTIYVGASGDVFPCCHLGASPHDNRLQTRQEVKEVMQIKNIKYKSFHSIANEKFWEKLDKRIETNPIETCIQRCGKFTK